MLLSRSFPAIISGIAVVGVLASCTLAPKPLKTSLTLDIGQDDTYYIPPALDATAAQFFNVSGGTGNAIDIDGDTLSSSSDTPYSRTQTQQLRLGARAELPLSPHLSLSGAMTLAKGKSRYLLPNGAGILSDPITIRFDTTTVELETGLIWQTGTHKRINTQVELGARNCAPPLIQLGY